MSLAERLARKHLDEWTDGPLHEPDVHVIAAIREALNEAIMAVWDSRTIEEAAAKIGAL